VKFSQAVWFILHSTLHLNVCKVSKPANQAITPSVTFINGNYPFTLKQIKNPANSSPTYQTSSQFPTMKYKGKWLNSSLFKT